MFQIFLHRELDAWPLLSTQWFGKINMLNMDFPNCYTSFKLYPLFFHLPFSIHYIHQLFSLYGKRNSLDLDSEFCPNRKHQEMLVFPMLNCFMSWCYSFTLYNGFHIQHPHLTRIGCYISLIDLHALPWGFACFFHSCQGLSSYHINILCGV